MEQKYVCCICGEEFKGYGNNPYPLVKAEGARCCNNCNDLVILARIDELVRKEEKNDKSDISRA